MFIETFVKRPILASVCSVIIFLAGLICIPLLPVEQYPQLAPSQITVTSNYIGADAQTVEATVTTLLEQAINGARGMKYMTSSSGNDGTSTINIIFDSERSLDDALLDVQNRVKQVEARLPQEVKTTGVTVDKNSTALTLMYVLNSENDEYDAGFLSNYTDRYIRDTLQRTNGVASIMIFGERIYAMRLWLDPFKLASKGLTASDVVKTLEEQNIQVASGQIGGTPVDENQTIQMNIQAPGRLQTPEEFDDMVLKTEGNNVIRLKDVGRAELGAESYNTISNYNGKESIAIAVFQLPDANAIDVSKQIKSKMAEIEKNFPPGLNASLTIDTSNIVKESIQEVLLTLTGSILLVIAVIYLFLQNARTTIIPAITIPVSLIGTFMLLKVFGFSINTLTLFGIVLATGLVVDDAIIVVENIERFIRNKKMNPKEAAIEGMKEIFSAVIATSLVLITVFVPIAFFPGTTGKLYKQFALTIAFSIAFSAFVSVTLTPAMSAILLKEKPDKVLRIFRKFNIFLKKTVRAYKKVLRTVLNNRKRVFIVFYCLLGVTLVLFKLVPQAFIPIEDQAYFSIMIQAPEGTSLNQTQKIVQKINKILEKEKDIKGAFEFTGYSFTGKSSNKSLMYVDLKPNHARKGKKHSANAIVNRLNKEFSNIPDAIIAAFEPPAIEGIGTVGGFQFEIKDDASHSLEELDTTTKNIIAESLKSRKLSGLFSSFTANNPQIDLKVDKLKAKQMNLSLKEIYDTLQVFLGSVYVNDFTYLNKSYRVYAQADKEFRMSPENIGQLYVKSADGQMFPLSNLTSFSTIYGADTIFHYNLRRSAEITGSAAQGTNMGNAVKEMEKIASKVLPQNFSYEWSGIVLEQQESGKLAGVIFLLSFVFVFLILAAQYENLFAPMIILLAVPLAIFGAMSFQFLRGLDNDVFCQIGLVMLIGLASKNAILIVEFANQLHAEGANLRDAVTEAAFIRFRPIMMTSFACILGITPLVFATGVGAASRISMGTTVFGGMIVSTILNLFLIPILYITIMTLQKRLKSLNTPQIKERFSNMFKKNMKKFCIGLIVLIFGTIPAYCITNAPPDITAEYTDIEWWNKFNDPILTEYVIKTAQSNYDIKINALKVLEGKELVKEGFANELPTINFNPTASREKFSGNIPFAGMFFPSYYTTNIRFPLTVNYEADIWGKNRNYTKKLKKELDALKYDEKAAFISLTTMTGATYFNILCLDKQIQIQKELVDIRQEILDLTRINFEYGLSSSTDVTIADKLYTESLSDLETLKKEQGKLLNQLAVLTGKSSENSFERGTIDDIEILKDLPSEIPSEIIEQRPDILKSEAQLQAAAFDVKIAKRNLLPSINLTGFLGFNAYNFSTMFDWKSFISSAGGGLTQPIFQDGRLRARLKSKKYKYEQMFNSYQKTILTSIQEINDSLIELNTGTTKNQNDIKRVECETKYYNDMLYKYEKGAVSYLDTLKYKENLLTLRKEEIQSKTEVLTATLSLYKSVGGKL